MDLTSVLGNQVISIKVEEVPHMKEDDPGQLESPIIKAEPLVSCVCVCPLLSSFCRYPESSVFRSVCLST